MERRLRFCSFRTGGHLLLILARQPTGSIDLQFTDQSRFRVRCEWGMRGLESLKEVSVVVIVDVLSFSTCVDVATKAGATVLPFRYKDEAAQAYAKSRNALLAEPRSHNSFSLSPSTLKDIPEETRLVLPSPNGSSLTFAVKNRKASVAIGCVRNCSAVASWADERGGPVAVIPAGELWPDGAVRPALEDWIGAGAIIRHLSGTRSPEARAAVHAFEGVLDLKRTFLECSSGVELANRGYANDIELAAEVDVSNNVPVLRNDEIIGTRSPA